MRWGRNAVAAWDVATPQCAERLPAEIDFLERKVRKGHLATAQILGRVLQQSSLYVDASRSLVS